MGIEDIRDALIIREHAAFLLTDTDGNVPRGNEQGLGIYRADTRHLSVYDFRIGDDEPVMLLSSAEPGYAMEQVMTNPTVSMEGGRTIRRGSTEIRRQRIVADAVEERVRVTNFNPFPVTLELHYEFDADFADIFDVRGYERERSGTLHEPEVGERSIR
jgi:glycogen debranching enzyme